jgi:type II secretory ATPase GspE/PulE/Tfp pilus assembly ATPase PilB-like protein
MDVEPFLLASTLRGALAQRLVRRLCKQCKATQACSGEDVHQLGPAGRSLVGRDVCVPVGCEQCLEGFRGRSGVFELLTVTPELQEQIRAGQSGTAALRGTFEKGGASLLEDGVRKVADGETSIGEVVNVCHARGV